MNKADLLHDLDEENSQWEALIAGVPDALMDQPGVAGHWSMKDVIAHITSWRRRTVQRLQAVATGEPLPPPPWPAELKEDDLINAWFYEREHGKPVRQVLDDSGQVFQQMRAAIASIPDAVLADPARFPWLQGQPLAARTFFGHFHDEHEADMRAWLAQHDRA